MQTSKALNITVARQHKRQTDGDKQTDRQTDRRSICQCGRLDIQHDKHSGSQEQGSRTLHCHRCLELVHIH